MSQVIDRFQERFDPQQRALLYEFLSRVMLSPNYGVGTAMDVRHLAPVMRFGLQHDDEAKEYILSHPEEFTDKYGTVFELNRNKWIQSAAQYNLMRTGGDKEHQARQVALMKVGPQTDISVDPVTHMTWQDEYFAAYNEALDTLPDGPTNYGGGNVPNEIPIRMIMRDTARYLPFEEELGFNPYGMAIGLATAAFIIYASGGVGAFFSAPLSMLGVATAAIPTSVVTVAGALSAANSGVALLNALAGTAIAVADPEGQGELNEEAKLKADLQLQQNALQKMSKDWSYIATGEEVELTEDEVVDALAAINNMDVEAIGNIIHETIPPPTGPEYPGGVGAQSTGAQNPYTYQRGIVTSGGAPDLRQAQRTNNPTGGSSSDEEWEGFKTVDEAIAWWVTNHPTADLAQIQALAEANPEGFLAQANAAFFQIENPRVPWVGEGIQGSPINPSITGYTSDRWRYTEEDFSRTVDNMTPGQLESFVEEGIMAGLLPETYQGTGFLDELITSAMESVMYSANLSGKTWQEQLTLLANTWQDYMEAKEAASGADERKARGYALEDFVPSKPFVGLDPAAMNQYSKTAMRTALRRDPEPWEIELMNEEQKRNRADAYSQEVAAEFAQFEAQGRAIEFDEPQQIEGSFIDVDEDARFAEDFEKRYEVELDEEQRSAKIRQDSVNLFGGLRSLGSSVGRG